MNKRSHMWGARGEMLSGLEGMLENGSRPHGRKCQGRFTFGELRAPNEVLTNGMESSLFGLIKLWLDFVPGTSKDDIPLQERKWGAHLPFSGNWSCRWIFYRVCGTWPGQCLITSPLGCHSFAVSLRTEVWVALCGWLHMNIVCLSTVTHLGTNEARYRLTPMMQPVPLSQARLPLCTHIGSAEIKPKASFILH